MAKIVFTNEWVERCTIVESVDKHDNIIQHKVISEDDIQEYIDTLNIDDIKELRVYRKYNGVLHFK